MEEYQELYSKIFLIPSKILELNTMTNQKIVLQIDARYRIGKSVAILINDQVIGFFFLRKLANG